MSPMEYFWLVVYLLRGVHCFSLHVEDTGLKSWNIDDTALVLYITLSNKGSDLVEDVSVDTYNCCLNPEDAGPNNECPIFQVMGDFAPFIKAGSVVNLTLLMPTIYPYDRHGDCTLEVWYNSSIHIQHQVHFDTRISDDNWKHLPPSVRDIAGRLGSCETPDLNPFQACHPIKCLLKYGANRGFFNPHTKTCEKPPRCTTTPDRPMIFSTETVACKDEVLKLGDQHEPKGMNKSHTVVWEEFSLLKKYKKECVHGEMTSGGCQCDIGWMTSTDGRSAFDNVDMVYKLCNTQTDEYIDSLRPTNLLAWLIAISLLALILLATLVTITQYHSTAAVRKLSQVSLTTLRRTLIKREQQEGLNRELFAIARAICSHEKMLDGELPFNKGDVVTELEKTEIPGMWKGASGGQYGMFPVACVEFFLPTDSITGD